MAMGAVSTSLIPDNVFAGSIQLEASTEQSLCCESSIALYLEDPAYTFLSGTGRLLPSQRSTASPATKYEITAHYQNDREMLFFFDHPLGLGELSPELNVFVLGDTTVSVAPTVRWSTFDEHHNIIRTGSFDISATTSIRAIGENDFENFLPSDIQLLRFYPNPATGVTTIEYACKRGLDISLELYNQLGEKVGVIEDGWKNQGIWSVAYNTGVLPSGTYFLKLSSGDNAVTKQMKIVK